MHLRISADSHFVEPPDLWSARMSRSYRDRAPRTQHMVLEGRDSEFFVCEGVRPVNVSAFFATAMGSDGMRPDQVLERMNRGFEAAPRSVWDPAERLLDQDRDGVAAEVLYSSMGMLLFGLEDGGLRADAFRAFNDWALEYAGHDRKRLLPVALIALDDVDLAVAELERVARLGMRGAMIWSEPPAERPYSRPEYEPFWSAACDLGIPVSLHASTSRRAHPMIPGDYTRAYLRLPWEFQATLTDLVLGGVLERHPALALVSVENDVTWLPHYWFRIDHAYRSFGPSEGLSLSRLPSEFVREQLWATFTFEDQWREALGGFAAQRVMWGSDYPHPDSTWPNSAEFIRSRFAETPAEILSRVLGANAAQLYRI